MRTITTAAVAAVAVIADIHNSPATNALHFHPCLCYCRHGHCQRARAATAAPAAASATTVSTVTVSAAVLQPHPLLSQPPFFCHLRKDCSLPLFLLPP